MFLIAKNQIRETFRPIKSRPVLDGFFCFLSKIVQRSSFFSNTVQRLIFPLYVRHFWIILIVVQWIQFPCKNNHIPAIAVPKLKIDRRKAFFVLGERSIMERLLTVREVTELLRISYPTLYRWLKAGTFPQPINGRGRKLLWHPADVERWSNYRQPDSGASARSKLNAKSWKQRQESASARLSQHGIVREGVPKPDKEGKP